MKTSFGVLPVANSEAPGQSEVLQGVGAMNFLDFLIAWQLLNSSCYWSQYKDSWDAVVEDTGFLSRVSSSGRQLRRVQGWKMDGHSSGIRSIHVASPASAWAGVELGVGRPEDIGIHVGAASDRGAGASGAGGSSGVSLLDVGWS